MSFLEDVPGFCWDRPVWIIGNPRSGTSLLRLMLHLHPSVCIPPESHFFLWLEDRYRDWDLKLLDTYLDDLYNSTKFETWQLDRPALKAFISDQRPASYAQLNCLVYLYYGLKNGKKPLLWGDKNKLWKEKLPVVLREYPEARFIHVVRDGRDIACSFRELADRKLTSKYAPRVPTDIEHLSDRWHRNISAIMDFGKKLKAGHFHTVRYEDLLTNTRDVVAGAFEYLGIPFLGSVLDYHKIEDTEKIEPAEFFQWKSKLLEPPDPENIGKYRSMLSPEEIDHFNTVNRGLLEAFGYAC